jgi:DNA relaxase NicK
MQVDWIAGTIVGKPIPEGVALVRGLLGQVGWVELDHGGYGYECSALASCGGRVYWSNVHPVNGVHFSLPSRAIASLGVPVRKLLMELLRMGAQFTRLDFAFDDRSAVLSLGGISEAVKSGSLVSRFKKAQHLEGYLQSHGETWAFGSRSSASYVRIYDKAAEQGLESGEHWVRVELELKDERAQQAMCVLLFNTAEADWSGQAASWVLSLLDFKVPNEGDSNKSRWETAEWWARFLGYCRKSALTLPAVVRSVDDVRRWFMKQVAPSAFVLLEVDGWESLLRTIGEACNRLQPKHLAMIAERR